MSILLLSGLKDIEIDAVACRLSDRNTPFFRLNTYSIDAHRYTFRWDGGHETDSILPFDPESIHTVWNRLPINIRGYVRKESSAPDTFLAEETFWFLHNVASLTPNARWVNDPHHEERANCKRFQLEAAAAVGLRVPRTRLTNSPDEVRQMAAACDRLVYKPVFHSGQVSTDSDLAVYTSEITASHLERLDQLPMCPGFFQELIEKTIDVRVIIFGSSVYAFALGSQQTKGGEIDWRRAPFDEVPCHAYTLPEKESKACLKLMRQLRLHAAAADFVVDRNGTHYFLEMNPGGRWLQFASKVEEDLADRFASYLGQSESINPLSVPASASL